MSSLSVRFNSFSFLYSIFNEQQISLRPPVFVLPTPSGNLSDFGISNIDIWLSALPTGRSGWIRTIDLALIRRAL